MTQTPEQIAAGLTKAQRELFDLFDSDDEIVFVPHHLREAHDELFADGILSKFLVGMIFAGLERLGQQVRTILENRNDADA